MKRLRLLFAILAIFVFILCLAFLAMFPLQLRSDRVEMSRRFTLFQATAKYVHDYRNRHGNNPQDTSLQDWITQQDFGSDTLLRLGVDGEKPNGHFRVGCALDEHFKPKTDDEFVVSAWNGDFFYCYAYPSGLTNLPSPDQGSNALRAELTVLFLAFASVLIGWRSWPFRTKGKT